MKKEIIIALLCAGLMLVTPFSVVARENTISSNLSEQPDDIEGLVVQIRVIVNEILQKYGHIPMVRSLCNAILNTLSWYPGNILICIMLFIILIPLGLLVLFILNKIGFMPYFLSSLLFALFLTFENNCLPITPFLFDWFSSFQSIYSMLNVNDNKQSFEGCPCLEE